MADHVTRATAARLATLVFLIAACGPHGPQATQGPDEPTPPKPATPPPGETAMVSTSLQLAPNGPSWSLAFVLENTTAGEFRGQLYEPFVGFKLEVTSATGERLVLVEPSLDMPVRPRLLVLAPGAKERLQTPIRLRFDPAVPPSGGDDPRLWTIRSAPVPVRLRATLEITGMPLQVADATLDPG